jgi:hypothetical protein
MEMKQKSKILFLICWWTIFSASAQLGYEWIDFSKDYIRIKTYEDGIYYLTKSSLTSAGMPSNVDPRTLRLYHRGVEQLILLPGEADGAFDTNDTLYFYGERNDGTLDAQLYRTPTAQSNKLLNLHSDTTVYFLNWGGSFSLYRTPLVTATASSPQLFHSNRITQVFTNEYARGREFGDNRSCFFDIGEGWTSDFFSGPFTFTLNGINNVYTSGTDAVLEIQVVGRNHYGFTRSATVKVGNPSAPDFTGVISGFSGYASRMVKFTLPASVLSSNNLQITVEPFTDPTSSIPNAIAVNYAILHYSQLLTSPNSTQKNYYFDGLSAPVSTQIAWSGSNPFVFDISNPDSLKQVSSSFASGTISASLESGTKELLVLSRSMFKLPFSVSPKQFSYPDSTKVYNILTHSLLLSGAQEYANYRASLAGGNYTVNIDVTDNLYDLFSYGEFTSLAIFQYSKYQTQKNENARFLFLIGKGLDLNFGKYDGGILKYYRWHPDLFHTFPDESFNLRNFVPTAGSPGSDIVYVMDGLNNVYNPKLAVGRLSSKNNQMISLYLNKVEEHEVSVDSNLLWRKHLVHLSGGNDLAQVNAFLDYVNQFKGVAENSLWGGKVIKTLSKDLGSAVSKISISEEVNAGLSFITFYGHSAATLTDLDIGYASADIFGYRNKGKYPMLIINGCNSANAYFNYSLVEDWVNTPDRGAILGLGVSDIGYTYPLYNYSMNLYRHLFNKPENFRKPAGEIIKSLLNDPTFAVDEFTETQMNLHGDPAVTVYSPSKPDYEISGDEEDRDDDPEQKVFFKTADGSKVTAATQAFKIGIPIKNYGVFDKDSFNIQVKRIVNGKTVVYPYMAAAAIRYMDTLYYDITDNNQIAYFGLNKFEIYVDITDSIHEMREDNNIATINYFMPVSAVTCLFPKEFSIVNDSLITFVAQSTDLLVDQTSYHFEMDTSYFFNSPYKRTQDVFSGALVKWTNQFILTADSVVYYWRVRLTNIPDGQDTAWSTSSFIHIGDSPDGWSQSHAGQYQKNDKINVSIPVPTNQNSPYNGWTFSPSNQRFFSTCFGNGTGNTFDSTSLSAGSYRLLFPGYWLIPCGPNGGENTSFEFNGMYAMAFDPSTLEPFIDVPGFGTRCGRFPYSFVYPMSDLNSQSNRDYFINWLNAVPTNYLILIGNSGNAYYDQWGDKNTSGTLRNALLTKLGATKLDDLNDNEPYILFSSIGATTPISEKHSNNPFASVTLDTTLTSKFNNGSLVSTIIGPSLKWKTHFKRMDSLDGSDRSRFSIIRIKLDGTSDTLSSLSYSKNSDNIDYLDLEPLVDAAVYPYIKLMVSVYDSAISLTPPQLQKWQVIYQKVPEGSMNPFVAGLNQYNDGGRRDEGTAFCYSYVFENISDLPFDDSLKVSASVFNALVGQKDSTFVVKPDSLDPGESFTFNYCFNSKGLSGNSTFRMFVNPYNQPEEYYNNNIIETSYSIQRDKTPPVIDVTFDGVHIMDGDIVSPSPVINITLNDNSRFLVINDPSKISMFLRRPGSSVEETIPYNSPEIVRFGQEAGNSNTFTIEYHPKNLPDGKYTIVVQGEDVNGNKSGKLYYIKFEVVNASTISSFYPYPNPFSSSTQFVFTLTGNEIPEDLKIQILTVTGKVVREITKQELGPIHAGNNKSQYAWDGTDEFGDKLANGVYLYRVLIKNKGGNFEHRETAGDKSFKKEFGKLYILR